MFHTIIFHKLFFSYTSFFLGGMGAWFVARYAHLLGLIDKPTERSSHEIPTPKGGGLGILFALVFFCSFNGILISLWAPAVSLSLLSLLGDKLDLNPKLRLVVQFSAAMIFLLGFYLSFEVFLLENFHSSIKLPLMTILCFVTAVYIVGTANFYNFMDGINGIAGITGIVGFGLLGLYGLSIQQDSDLPAMSFTMACACLGFLPFNIPKAKVFMGDVGSILLGFMFACLVVLISSTFLDFIAASAFLLPFYADELSTLAVRLKDRENLALPHRRHLYQLLANEMEIAHWKVSAGFGIFQLAVGLSVMCLKLLGVIPLLVFITGCYVLFFKLSFHIRNKLKSGISSQQ